MVKGGMQKRWLLQSFISNLEADFKIRCASEDDHGQRKLAI